MVMGERYRLWGHFPFIGIKVGPFFYDSTLISCISYKYVTALLHRLPPNCYLQPHTFKTSLSLSPFFLHFSQTLMFPLDAQLHKVPRNIHHRLYPFPASSDQYYLSSPKCRSNNEQRHQSYFLTLYAWRRIFMSSNNRWWASTAPALGLRLHQSLMG